MILGLKGLNTLKTESKFELTVNQLDLEDQFYAVNPQIESSKWYLILVQHCGIATVKKVLRHTICTSMSNMSHCIFLKKPTCTFLLQTGLMFECLFKGDHYFAKHFAVVSLQT